MHGYPLVGDRLSVFSAHPRRRSLGTTVVERGMKPVGLAADGVSERPGGGILARIPCPPHLRAWYAMRHPGLCVGPECRMAFELAEALHRLKFPFRRALIRP